MQRVKGLNSFMRLDETDDFISPSFFTDYWDTPGSGKLTREPDPQEKATVSFTDEETRLIPAINRALISQTDKCIAGNGEMFFFQFSREIYRPQFWQLPPDTRFANGAVGALNAIQNFHGQLQEHDIPLLIVVTPRSGSIFPGLATGMPFSPTADRHVNFPVANFVKHLNSLGIHALNLTPVFMKNRWKTRDGKRFPVTLPHEDHWSGFGAKLAALETFKAMKGISGFDSRLQGNEEAFSGVLETEDTLKVGGTFQRFFRDNPGRVQPRETIIHRLKGIEAAEKAYEIRNRPRRGIMIGDSYLRMYAKNQASYPQHLKFLLSQDLQVISPNGGITSSRQILARTVAPDEISFVIWELAEDFLPLHQLWREVPIGTPRIIMAGETHFNRSQGKDKHWIIKSDTLTGIKESSIIHESPRAGSDVSITWESLRFGKAGSFIASLAVGPAPLLENQKRTAVVFQVMIDGEIIAARNITTKSQGSATVQDWEIPLGKFRGRSGEFTLRCQVQGRTNPEFVGFRNPVLNDATF